MDISYDLSAAAALLERVRAADGRSPDQPPPKEQVRAAEYDGNHLVALAWRPSAHDPAELYVDPEHRRRGRGGRLARQLVAEPNGAAAGIWAHGTGMAARALATHLDLAPVRELLQLRGPLPPAVDAATPDGVAIRTFESGVDDDAFLAVNARAFAWHPEQGRLDRAGLDAEKAQSWFDPDGFFLAVRAERPREVLGFHWTKVHPAAPPSRPEPLGEIYVIGVDPQSPIRGLGLPLAVAGLRYLARQGLRTALLYVEADNDRALSLYDTLGFTEYARDTVFARR